MKKAKQSAALALSALLLFSSWPVYADEAPVVTEKIETLEAESETAAEDVAETVNLTETIDAVPETSADDLGKIIETEQVEETAEFEEVYVEAAPVEGVPYDNEELFSGYVNQVFGISDDVSLMGGVWKSLDPAEYAIYSFLKNEFTAIANGQRSSTAIKIPVNQLDLPAGTTVSLTNELFSHVNKALLYDCPYICYWYYKSMSASAGTGYDANGRYIMFYYPVYTPFRGSEEYTVDVTKTSAASLSAQNARQIVAQNANLSDYDKLLTYKNNICSLTDYNDDAIEADYDSSYGDPWQMIYVFDGDPLTKVVCEGYSKAFQYLFDQSTFNNQRLDCRLVSGVMAAPGTSGGHMWNVVTMQDGKNYIVDVTNSDDGTIGDGGELFLGGTAIGDVDTQYQFTIDSRNYVIYKYESRMYEMYGTSLLTLSSVPYSTSTVCAHEGGTATCTYKAICDYCGQPYGTVNPAKHGATEVRNAKTATCAVTGYTGDTYCKDCGAKTASGTTIAKTTDHKGGTATCAAKAICTVCGQAYGALNPSNHTGATEIRNAKAATCAVTGYTGDTYCKDCSTKISSGTTIAKNLSNHAGKTEVRDTVEPTVDQEGYTGDTYCCDCDTMITAGKVIDKLPAPVGMTRNLKAVPAGKNKVTITWDPVEDAEGYLIYAQKNGKYGFCGMTTTGCTYLDKNALDTDYNFYFVFAYIRDDNGKMITGGCEKYTFAKGVCLAVTNLKAVGQTGGVKLTWDIVPDADGYLVYGFHGSPHSGATYGYIGYTNKRTLNSFVDRKALTTDYNYYYVFPFHYSAEGKMVSGGTAKYVWGKAR